MGVDILTQAKSGMGKTAIFVLSVLQQMEEKPNPVSCMILAHTRELAYQIDKEFLRFCKYFPAIKHEVIYGGEPISKHKDLLKKEPPHIIVGTPGRISALVESKDLDLSKLRFFILDECDKMLDQTGFRLTYHRHERNCSEHLSKDTEDKTSDDVFSNTSSNC